MPRNIAYVSMLTLLTVLLACPLVFAQTGVVNYTDRGWYTSAGNHTPSNLSYLVGDSRGSGCAPCLNDFHNFFVFNLSLVTQPITSAKLAVLVPSQPGQGYVSPDLSENYELHDIVTPIATLRDGTGGVATHADLGSGVAYGSRTMSAADMGNVVEITLNSSAITALNSSHGLFGIGGSLTTLDNLPNFEYTFGWTNTGTETTQLRLTLAGEPTGDYNRNGLVDTGDYVIWRKNNGTLAEYNVWRSHYGQTVGSGSLFNSTVPEPTALVFLGIGAISLLGYRKAKSRG